jgi:hypothetical protein
MNLKMFIVLVAVLAALTWILGDGIESIQEEQAPDQENVIGNTLDAARNAADSMSR